LVAECGEIGGGCSLAEHLLDGVAGDEMDEEEDERDDDPDDREGEGYAGEDGFHRLVLR
jgi:hypothetical protein